MNTLLRLYGWPHEALHRLALWLLGRRALAVGRAHVDIPADLSRRAYVFVAGLPALVFGSGMALGVVGLLNATTVGQALLALSVTLVMGLGAAGTVGDIQQILLRLAQPGDHSRKD